MFTGHTEFGWSIVNFFVHGTKATYAAIGTGLVMGIVYFGIFFKDLSDFQDAWSDFSRGLLRRQFSGRISFWLIISIGSGMLAYYQLPEWFPGLFGHAG